MGCGREMKPAPHLPDLSDIVSRVAAIEATQALQGLIPLRQAVYDRPFPFKVGAQ